MILIRGIKGDSFARRIERGVVDCRDVLSAVLEPPVTGYEYSDYYEKNFVKALMFFKNMESDSLHLHDPMFLYSLLIDYYIPHIYLTYFHILNERSEEWLDKFDDDYSFIAINPRIDKITNAVIGDGFFGSKMTYVDSIRNCSQDQFYNFYAACLCSIGHMFSDKLYSNEALQIYNTLCFPLLHREQNEKFTDIENEFRIVAFNCPRISGTIRSQLPREAIIKSNRGYEYHGTLLAGQNTDFECNLKILQNRTKPLIEVLMEENGMIKLDSKFKAINMRSIAKDCMYIGNKSDCSRFITKTLANPPKDVYIDRRIRREYKIDTLKNAFFLPGYQKVDY